MIYKSRTLYDREGSLDMIEFHVSVNYISSYSGAAV